MKWIDRNILYITFGFLAACIAFQMWYIQQLKSELKLFHNKEQIIIKDTTNIKSEKKNYDKNITKYQN